MGISLCLKMTKNAMHGEVLLKIWHHLPPQPSLLLSPIKKHHYHQGENNGLCNAIFLLPDTKSMEVKLYCHPDILLK